MPNVECKVPRKCALIFSFGFTPSVSAIQPGVTLSNTRLTYIVKRQQDLDLVVNTVDGSRPLARVAAIESRSPTNTEPFYVLYERITGSICILSGADIPTEVRGFVASYKAVLKGLS